MKTTKLSRRSRLASGDRVDSGSNEYIIAHVDSNGYQAINLMDGNRWSDPPVDLDALKSLLIADGFHRVVK